MERKKHARRKKRTWKKKVPPKIRHREETINRGKKGGRAGRGPDISGGKPYPGQKEMFEKPEKGSPAFLIVGS